METTNMGIETRADRDASHHEKGGAPRRCLLLAAAAVLGLAATPARADHITFAVIGPHEYDLPVDFQPFNVFVQYGDNNVGNLAFNNYGGIVHGNDDNSFVGLSKYVFFWCFPNITNIGFAYEVITPEVGVTGPGTGEGVRGIGDTLTGPAMWFKPTPNSTLGVQNFLQVPVGMPRVTNGYWADYASIFFDAQWPMVSLYRKPGHGKRLKAGATEYARGRDRQNLPFQRPRWLGQPDHHRAFPGVGLADAEQLLSGRHRPDPGAPQQ